ncbi:alpha/beta hydrolase [Streptomyces sp. 150FB]|uniref:alpha/beta fold hydrolase n=1 Tax=Streptomyces sp. 150FB TaxID=1576605 RepID=UPI00058928ED|nr:alpha/beta hydrolase [Streptomyces sp. 150FB]KIF77565.1 alpha/beta hydrolase [Streptomyces sp. 150FB]
MHKRPKHRALRITALTVAGLALAGGATTLASAAPSYFGKSAPKPTVVLVNGAWSGPSSWSKEIKSLQAAGYPVTAPPTALRSLSDDSAYLGSYLKTIKGPVVLVGQSYGGSVITNAATGNSNVKALVYISAFAPDKGETVQGLTAKFPGTRITTDPNPDALPTALSPVPFTLANGTSGVDLYAKADQYRDLFLSNRLSSKDSAELAAEQSPINSQALSEASGEPAWRTIPSWYLVSKEDHLIPPAAERFMAARAHAHTVVADTPHAAQVTDPSTVTRLIEQAADATR